MTKHFFPFLLVLIFTACANESAEKKVETTDSITKVSDSTIRVNAITPVNLDSLADTEAVPASTEAVAIKFNLPEGKSFAYNASIDINQEMPGQSIQSKMSYNYILKVNRSEKGSKQLVATYGDMSMQMEMNGKKMNFGAGSKEEPMNPMNMIGKMFSAMKGKSFVMDVNQEGEITRVEGFDKIADAVITELNIPEAGRENFSRSFKSQFNENSVKQMFSESFNIFPSGKVKPGDTWKKKASLPMANKAVDVFTTYTLKELRGNNYIVDARTKYQNAGSKPVIGTSRLLVDSKSGLVHQLDGEQKLEGSNTVISRSRIRSKAL